MIEDKSTTTLYLSSLLPMWYPNFWNGFKDILDRNQINYLFLEGTKDVWARDYMPIQVTTDKFVQFRFKPDYYKKYKSYKDKITNQEDVVYPTGLNPVQSTIVLDGGNVVKCKNKVILTSKAFSDNPTIPAIDLINSLKILLEVDQIIIIPIMPGDETGHSDGTVRFINSNKVLVADYPIERGKFFVDGLNSSLLTAGLEIVPIPYLAHQNLAFTDDTGDYINFLQLGHVIFVPQYGFEEDKNVMEIFSHHFAGYKIEPVDCSELAKGGGVLNCISWGIYDSNLEVDWENIFENKKQQLIEELQKEIDNVYKEDDSENPTFKRRKKFSEICLRQARLWGQNRPNNLDPSYTTFLENSFKKELANRFYIEWKVSNGEQQFLNRKTTNFIKKVVPELRNEFRQYMKYHNPSFSFTYQPEFIDASNELIIDFLAEYTGYQDFIEEFLLMDSTSEGSPKGTKLLITRAQQALAFFFLVRNMGIDQKVMNKRALSKLFHLLSNEPIPEEMDNSNLYKAVKQLFTKKTIIGTLKDVQIVHKIFNELAVLNSPIINNVIQDLKNHEADIRKD